MEVVGMNATFDIECYENYFLMVMVPESGPTLMWERFNDIVTLGSGTIPKDFSLISFNGYRYDMLLLKAFMLGCVNSQLKAISDCIIVDNMMPWDIERLFNLPYGEFYDHVDIIQVLPQTASLKIYGGRIGTAKLQDLPVDPSALINIDQIPLMRQYCGNDNNVTWELRNKVVKEIALRETMSSEYGKDLRSKSDAQIAETVIVSECEKLSGHKITKPGSSPHYTYTPPPFIKFETPELQEVLEDIKAAKFTISDKGKMIAPEALENRLVKLGDVTYKLGIGGIHSVDRPGSFYAGTNDTLMDIDVTSYYPMAMLNCGYVPGHIGPSFEKVYRGLVDRRVVAKKAGNDTDAATLKIVVNGTYGKLGSKYSKLYSPGLMVATTVTGQLSLLMLIEKFPQLVVSANTDGMTLLYEKWMDSMVRSTVSDWEEATKFNMEYTEYKSYHRRDCNNYIVVKPDNSTKVKGIFKNGDLSKNPVNMVVNNAILAHLTKGAPITDTITNCTDVRDFLSLRTVKGGAIWQEQELGKSIRWYYGKGCETEINYKTNGNKVPRSDGAIPLMDLPDSIPDDLDYQWYINEANSILEVIL
jgi:hypothetical protein